MRKTVSILIATMLSIMVTQVFAKVPYGQILCKQSEYACYKAKYRDSWAKLFPNPRERDLVKRINRTSNRIYAGMRIAIPHNLRTLDVIAAAPFVAKMKSPGEKLVIVDLNKLAWGAYNEEGHLIHWGPAVGGRGYCKDVKRACRTKTGIFRVFSKQPAQCVSSAFPIEWNGGAAMPFCMHYYRGFAMHGSYDVPGYNASHGCVRLFINDARWLNEQFTDIGTKVIVQPY